MDKNNKITIALIGDEKTGKTTFHKYLTDQFENFNFDLYQETTGACYGAKELIYNNKKYLLNLWDTSGALKYRSLIKFFIKDADIIFIFYDYSNRQIYVTAKELLEFAKDICEKIEITFILIANKYHINKNTKDDDEIIPDEEALEFAQENNMPFAHLSVSEKFSNGVNDIFRKVFKEYFKKKNV